MKCPYCFSNKTRVVDKRSIKTGTNRRRRECLKCGKRFTTYERVEMSDLVVIKKDGRREPFNHEKMRAGIQRACQKRPISINDIDDFVDSLGQLFQEIGHREIRSSDIGERVIEKLKEWDDVAYVRFASVYRQFKDINQFMAQLKELLDEKRGEGK